MGMWDPLSGLETTIPANSEPSTFPLRSPSLSGAFKLSVLVRRVLLLYHHKTLSKSSQTRTTATMTLTSTRLPTNPNPLFFSPKRHCFQVREFRVFRRRRLKTVRSLVVQSQFDDLFHNLISQFPSLSSLEFFAPLTLGFASGVTLHLSRSSKPNTPGVLDNIGEWILFTHPTPFNRFVLLRCPSVSFTGSELLKDVNKKLVDENRHFMRLDSGRMRILQASTEEERLEYQRVCVGTEDGGVISLDWPANLDLEEERGLDTTLLLVPGTPRGSMETNVRSFVCEALKRGCFPVVMNPRGCAGSPLTTAR